ncbi:proline-rich receptor-like protein kinase PERK2 [Micropterus dolomieu]|uniref:proline-rich receptor-like protein kinase PERK2 n=1 Tax=Micropterus dolomieu TaxID=147949 RepID=UPI001E8CBE8D|nr:proline-rich receptor-like protein kinase PERK2 [Micropterus dolomieu]
MKPIFIQDCLCVIFSGSRIDSKAVKSVVVAARPTVSVLFISPFLLMIPFSPGVLFFPVPCVCSPSLSPSAPEPSQRPAPASRQPPPLPATPASNQPNPCLHINPGSPLHHCLIVIAPNPVHSPSSSVLSAGLAHRSSPLGLPPRRTPHFSPVRLPPHRSIPRSPASHGSLTSPPPPRQPLGSPCPLSLASASPPSPLPQPLCLP